MAFFSAVLAPLQALVAEAGTGLVVVSQQIALAIWLGGIEMLRPTICFAGETVPQLEAHAATLVDVKVNEFADAVVAVPQKLCPLRQNPRFAAMPCAVAFTVIVLPATEIDEIVMGVAGAANAAGDREQVTGNRQKHTTSSLFPVPCNLFPLFFRFIMVWCSPSSCK